VTISIVNTPLYLTVSGDSLETITLSIPRVASDISMVVSLSGTQGVQGAMGSIGSTGIQGIQGIQGIPGLAGSHDDLVDVAQAGVGIADGHVSDQAQSFSGLKTFLNAIKAIGNSKFGEDITNYAEFESDGTLKFNGSATVWNDIILQVANLKPGNTPPTFSAIIGGIYGLRFNSGVADEVHGAFELPHDYKEGSALVVHCHWSPTTTNGGNIVFGFEYSLGQLGAVLTNALTPTSTPEAAPGVINRLVRTDIATLVGTNFIIGNIIAFRFYRQKAGTDTFTGNAFVHSIGIHYESDTLGSRQIINK